MSGSRKRRRSSLEEVMSIPDQPIPKRRCVRDAVTIGQLRTVSDRLAELEHLYSQLNYQITRLESLLEEARCGDNTVSRMSML